MGKAARHLVTRRRAQALAREQREIRFCLHLSGPVRIRADELEMAMVLDNLISNAVKYNRDGGSVEIRVTGHEGDAVVRVRDTGIGMS